MPKVNQTQVQAGAPQRWWLLASSLVLELGRSLDLLGRSSSDGLLGLRSGSIASLVLRSPGLLVLGDLLDAVSL